MGFITKLLATFFIIFITVFMTTLILLQSQYALVVVQKMFELLTPYKLQASKFDYNLLKPFTFTLERPELISPGIKSNENHTSIRYLSASFSPLASMKENLTFKNVFINGIDLNKFSIQRLPENIMIENLLMHDVNYESETFSFENAQLQLSKWQNNKPQSQFLWRQKEWGEAEGTFQFSSRKVKFKETLFTDLMINSEFQETKWELWDFSFKSVLGDFSGSATLQEENKWIFHQISLRDSRIENINVIENIKNNWNDFYSKNDFEIKQFDLLDVSVSLNDISIEHLNLSGTSLAFKEGKFVLTNTSDNVFFDFNSSLLRFKQWVLSDVFAEFSLSLDDIHLDAFSAKIDERGFLYISGALSPHSLALERLSIMGLDLTLTSDEQSQFIEKIAFLKNIEIKELNVKNVDYFLEDAHFPVQIAGLNLEGNNLFVRQDGINGIYKGEMEIGAIIANINHIPLLSSFAKLSVIDGNLTLNPLNLSFIDGQIDAIAKIELNKKSHPWFFNAQGLNVPIEIYSQWFQYTFPLKGEHDFKLDFSGISVNEDSFNYSLTGTFDAKPHQTLLKTKSNISLNQSLKNIFTPLIQEQETRPLEIENITLRVDRGRIKLSPITVKSLNKETKLSGEWDLVTKKGGFSVQNGK